MAGVLSDKSNESLCGAAAAAEPLAGNAVAGRNPAKDQRRCFNDDEGEGM